MTINGIIIFFIVLLVVSVFILLFPKIKTLFSKCSKNKKSKGKKKSSNSKGNSKLKPSNAAKNIRPILKPANSEKEKEDLKLLENQKENKQLDYTPTQALDFKYSGTKRPNMGFNNSNSDFLRSPVKPISPLPRQRTDEDVRRDFEDIKNFLDMPTSNNNATLNNRPVFNNNFNNRPSFFNNTNLPNTNRVGGGVNYNGFTPLNSSNFNRMGNRQMMPNNKIDPSIFNDEESDYFDYRSLRRDNINSPNITRNNLPNINKSPMLVGPMVTNNKYSRPQAPVYNDASLINRNEFKLPPKNNFENIVKYDDVDIDLNKLSPKLKRLIISNILKRKDFD